MVMAAARPNFMKIAPLYHELASRKNLEPVIVHTGQHYALSMSDIFDTVNATLEGRLPEGKIPDLWNGCTAGRVAET